MNTKTQKNRVWSLVLTGSGGDRTQTAEGKQAWMWVKAECEDMQVPGDNGEGINYKLVYYPEEGWQLADWVESTDSVPEFPQDIYEDLLKTPRGEMRVICLDSENYETDY